MVLTLLVVLFAMLLGFVRGGSLHTLSQLEFHLWPLVFAAVGVQVLGIFATDLGLPGASAWYVGGMVASAGLVVTFVVRNRWLRGMPLIALGFALNAIVVLANGAMPVDLAAMDRVGVSRHIDDAKHEDLTDASRLRFLADVVPVPMPLPFGSGVLSPGDVVLAAGIGALVANGMLQPRRRGKLGELARPA